MKIFDFDKFLDTLTGYIETKLELFKIDLREEVSVLVSKAIVYIAISLIAIAGLFFGFSALANWLNTILESRFLGYLLVCGIMLLLAGLIYVMRSNIQERILRKLAEEDSPSQQEDE